MNDAIESRVEALAFQYVGLGLFAVVNNLWTLVGVVTTAISVWSIRAAADSSITQAPRAYGDNDSIGRPNGRGSIPERRPADAIEESTLASLDHSSATSISADYPSSGLGDGVMKGRRKFTAYYKDDGGCELEGAAATVTAMEEEETGEGCSCGGGDWWERVLKARNGEMLWYRCQDTGVINGAVVRLWDYSRDGGSYRDCRE